MSLSVQLQTRPVETWVRLSTESCSSDGFVNGRFLVEMKGVEQQVPAWPTRENQLIMLSWRMVGDSVEKEMKALKD